MRREDPGFPPSHDDEVRTTQPTWVRVAAVIALVSLVGFVLLQIL